MVYSNMSKLTGVKKQAGFLMVGFVEMIIFSKIANLLIYN